MEHYLNSKIKSPGLSYDAILSMSPGIDMDLFSETHIKEIEKNGIPDLSGFYRCLNKWLTFFIDGYPDDDDLNRIYDLETDYLKNCSDKTKNAPADYSLRLFEQSSSEHVIRKIFLNQLIHDFSAGESKAKECLKILFSILDREKFKRMKKYRRITMKALLEDDFIPDYTNDRLWLLQLPTSIDYCAAYMAMAMSLDIELEPGVYILALFMNDAADSLEAVAKDSLEKIRQQSTDNRKALAHLDEEDFAFSDLDRKEIKRITSILNQAQLENDLRDDQLVDDVTELSYDTLDILEGAGIDLSKLSKKDLTYLSVLANLANFYFSNSTDMDIICNGLLYKNDQDDRSRLYDRIAGIKEQKQTAPIAKKILEAREKSFDEDLYLEEIQRLRDKIRDLEYNIGKQHDLYEKEKRRNNDYASLVEDLPVLKKELHALREFAYNSAENDLKEEPAIPRDAMLRFLNQKDVLIVGGHVNWTSKLKELFPKWKFATPKEQGSIPVPENVDHIFIFTGCLCHSQFNRHMDVIARKKIPMSYVARVNIEDNIKEFYKALS